MDNQKTPSGNFMPPYVREALEKARKPQESEQSQVTEVIENSSENLEKQTEKPVEQTQQPSETANTAETQSTEPQRKQDSETVPNSAESNEIKSWKGRLKKEQAERQLVNARLVEETEKREKAEQELARLKSLAQQTNTNVETTTQISADPKGLSAEELEEIGLVNPALKEKLIELQKVATSAQQVEQTISTPSQQQVQQTPNAMQQAQPPEVSVRDSVWYAEIQRVIPEMQGLLADPAFVEFASSNTDRRGKTDLDFIEEAGRLKDVSYLPALREIIDEFNRSKATTPPTVTAAPQQNATAKPKVVTKKQMTKKDQAHAELLTRTGKTAELKKFLAQFQEE